MAPECCSFSRAVNPPVRSKLEPWGMQDISPAMAEKVRRGNLHSEFVHRMVQEALALDLSFV